MRPINSIVDVSNYVMLELGQPNHTYDLATVPGGHLRVRWATAGEQIETLDPAACSRLLAATQVGRLALVAEGKPKIIVLNHLVYREGVFFRTALVDYDLYRTYFPVWALAAHQSCVGHE